MRLNVVQINSKRFTHNPLRKVLVTEHSDIGNVCWQQLYDDACDEGIALRNARTGNVTRWYVAERLREEGELVVTILKPTSESVACQPVLRGYELHVLND